MRCIVVRWTMKASTFRFGPRADYDPQKGDPAGKQTLMRILMQRWSTQAKTDVTGPLAALEKMKVFGARPVARRSGENVGAFLRIPIVVRRVERSAT